MATLLGIAPDEELGRRIASGPAIKRAKRSVVRHNEFMPSKAQRSNALSVDRLSIGALEDVAKVAQMENTNFYTWAFVIAEAAGKDGRIAVKSETPNNKYHAQINFPSSADGNRDIQKLHALRLKRRAQIKSVS